MASKEHRLLVIGAHPDDCELKAGGLAAKYRARGDSVKFVSMTNGATGHHEIGGVKLAWRRQKEAQAAGSVIDAEYEIFDNHTGELTPSIENRKAVIRLIRNYEPDLILTHRTNDYHPDHRYTSILVRDAAYVIGVPNMCPLTPALEDTPVIAHLSDQFEKPTKFEPDTVINIDGELEKKLEMIHCHESQMYEWLPYDRGKEDEVPTGDRERLEWLKEQRIPDFNEVANRYRDQLHSRYGAKAADIQCAEAFEISEYGASVDDEKMKNLFPA